LAISVARKMSTRTDAHAHADKTHADRALDNLPGRSSLYGRPRESLVERPELHELMSSASNHPLRRPFSQVRALRRIAFFLTFAVLFAGIAQAAHYHRGELSGHSQTDVHCLLCLFAGGNATPPAPIRAIAPTAPRYCGYLHPVRPGFLTLHTAASYEARGPPFG
jgi:hypothetical protein